MHRTEENGDHCFTGARSWPEGDILEEYVFEKANFEMHDFRHRISDAKALEEIDRTIFEPDRITTGHVPASKRNFYRVSSYKDGRNGERMLMLWRVHAFRKGKRHFIVATAFEGSTSVANAIHYLETPLWERSGSLV